MTQPSRETVAEAAAWISRLHSSRRSPDVEAALRSWLAADKQNAQAFEGMTELWDAVPAMHAGEFPSMQMRRSSTSSRLWVRAATMAGVCTAVGLLAHGLFHDPSYTTGIGEQRIVNLDDGTRVSLNSATRMTVAYGQLERRIELKQGEAYFEVAHDPRLPFVVSAGINRITALGTSFAVRYERDRAAVTLVEGKVAVVPAPASGSSRNSRNPAAGIVLQPGQRLILAKQAAPQLDTPKVDAVTSWRRGEVIFDETVLADAVAEMNRYDKLPLVIDDTAIAALPVSGIYRTGDSPGFAHIVARMYGLTVSQEHGRIHLKGSARLSP